MLTDGAAPCSDLHDVARFCTLLDGLRVMQEQVLVLFDVVPRLFFVPQSLCVPLRPFTNARVCHALCLRGMSRPCYWCTRCFLRCFACWDISVHVWHLGLRVIHAVSVGKLMFECFCVPS
jgi:hypothetical protein